MAIFEIEEDVAQLFPHLRIGLVSFSGVDNRGDSGELAALQEETAARARGQFQRDTFAALPELASWREAYNQFGANPNKTKPTLEAMLQRILKDKPFPRISKLVDAYLIVQTRYLLPIGGYDRDRLEGPVVLRRSRGGESFLPLGATQPEETRSQEVVYADGARVLTRNWNYRDSDETKVTAESKNVLLCLEAVSEQIPAARVKEAVQELAALVVRFCGGTAETFVANVASGQRTL